MEAKPVKDFRGLFFRRSHRQWRVARINFVTRNSKIRVVFRFGKRHQGYSWSTNLRSNGHADQAHEDVQNSVLGHRGPLEGGGNFEFSMYVKLKPSAYGHPRRRANPWHS